MHSSCTWGCVQEPASPSTSLLPQHRRTTPGRAPRLQPVVANCSWVTPAVPCTRSPLRRSGQLQQPLAPQAPAQPAAAAATALGTPQVRSIDSSPSTASGSGSNGGNNSSSSRHVGEDNDGGDGNSTSGSAGSILRGLLAGALLLQQQAQAGPAAAAWGSRSRLVSKQDEQRLLPGWEIDAFVDRMSELSGPIMSNMGFSGLLGAASAAALKWVGRTLAAAVGMSLLLVQVLSHYNVVTVNWSVVHRQAQQVLDRTGDGRLDKDDYKRVLKQGMVIMSEGVPSVSGFLVGFVVGMKVF